MFQSLSGFQVRCNGEDGSIPVAYHIGFNPYRVFKFVATSQSQTSHLPSGKFQSLSGFQVRCNPYLVDLSDFWLEGFNPYRVFKFVATSHD